MKKTYIITVFIASAFVFGTFATSSQAAPTAGSLVRGSLPGVYQIGEDGKRYVFPNAKTYFTWYTDFSGVQIISDSELAAIPLGGNVTYRPGTRMVKIPSDPKVYAVAAGGVLRQIGNEQTAAELYGSDWKKKIDDLPESFFANYSIGSAVNSKSDFSPSQETANATTLNTYGAAQSTTQTGSASRSTIPSSTISRNNNLPVSIDYPTPISSNTNNQTGASSGSTNNSYITFQTINSVTKVPIPNMTIAVRDTNTTYKTNAAGFVNIARLAGTIYVPSGQGYEASNYINPADYSGQASALIELKPDGSSNTPTEPVPGDAVTIMVKNSVTGFPIVGLPITIKNAAGYGQGLVTNFTGIVIVPRSYGVVYTPYTEGYDSSGEIDLRNYKSGDWITVALKPRETIGSNVELVFPATTHAASMDGGSRITGTVTKDGVPVANLTLNGAGSSVHATTDAQGKFVIEGLETDSVRIYFPTLVDIKKQFQVDGIKGETVTTTIEI